MLGLMKIHNIKKSLKYITFKSIYQFVIMHGMLEYGSKV